MKESSRIECKRELTNSPPEEGCPQGGVADFKLSCQRRLASRRCSRFFYRSSGYQPSLVRQKNKSFFISTTPSATPPPLLWRGIQPRNKELMPIFRDVDLVEQLGSGIPRIIKQYPRSIFKIKESFIRVIFPFETEESHTNKVTNDQATQVGNAPLTPNQEAIFKKLSQEPHSTVQELAQAIGISDRKIKDNLKKLKDRGLLRRVGTNRSGHWELLIASIILK